MLKNIPLIFSAALALLTSPPYTVSNLARPRHAPQGIHRHQRAVPDSYVVVLKDEAAAGRVRARALQLAGAHGGRLGAVYEHALRGFSVRMNEAAAEALSRHPAVAYVEEDAFVETATTQQSAPWGLDRIDQSTLPLSTTYTYGSTGAGVHVYVIDSGIRTSHQEFGGRASVAFDNVGDGQNGEDCFGHGTHVASVVGGQTFGVAKSARLHSVRIFNCSNTGSSITRLVEAIDFVTGEHQSPAVAVLSVSVNTSSTSVDTAVRNSIAAGITYAVAAGNGTADAAQRSPSRVAEAIVVGANDNTDTRFSVSNYGTTVDLFAPGVNIPGADWFDDTSTTTRDGTSMSAAHAAGVAATYLETHPFFASPAEVHQALIDHATSGVVTNPGTGSPNRLLHVIGQPQGSPAVSATKTDSFTSTTGTAPPGSAITYTVTISNTGVGGATGVVFTDYLDPNTTLVPGSVSVPNGGGSGNTVSVNVGTIPSGRSVTITFQATIDNPYAGGPNVSNQGTVSGSNFSTVLTDDPAVGGANDPTLTPVDSTQVRANDARQPEPPAGSAQMLYTVTLSDAAPAGGLAVNFATASGGGNPATGGASCGGATDYLTASGTLSIPSGQKVGTIPVTVCADSATSETDETLLLNISSPSAGGIADGQAVGTITAGNTAGALVISELRTSGPAGAGDDFVELYNNSSSPLTVAASDVSGGYGVYKMGAACDATPVLVAIIPNGTAIPAHGHYLLRGGAYSLTNYGGAGAAAGDLTMTSDIENDANLAVFSTANVSNLSSANRLDAVGFGSHTGGVCDLLREGANLAPVGGSSVEYSYFRKQCEFDFGGCATAGGIQRDTNDNAADFAFADTQGTFISGVTQRLGAPAPENLASPLIRGLAVVLLDGTKTATAAPNRVRDFTAGDPNNSPLGTLSMRRRIMNTTGATVTRLRFRVIEMTTFPSPGGGVADMRVITSSAATISGITDATTCASTGTPATVPCQVTVQATTLEAPSNHSTGGGYNSTLSVSIPGGLANNASINVNLTLGVVQSGSFRFFIVTEALP